MSGIEKRRRSLGRGLSSLIPNTEPLSTRVEEAPTKQNVAEINVETILPGDGQPRQIFEQEAIQELASSIKEHGILQPILVRKRYAGQYELLPENAAGGPLRPLGSIPYPVWLPTWQMNKSLQQLWWKTFKDAI